MPFAIFKTRRGDDCMWDWNNNGKYDLQDLFIDYHIYKSVTDSNKNQSGSSSDSGGCLTAVAVG